MTDDEIGRRLLKVEAEHDPIHTQDAPIVDGFMVVSHVKASLKFRGEIFDIARKELEQASDTGTTYINGTIYSAEELETRYPNAGEFYNRHWRNSHYIIGRSGRLYAFKEGDKRIVVSEPAGKK